MSTNENVDNVLDGVMEELSRREQSERDEKYRLWCDDFASLPENSKRKLKDGLIAHVELQPWHWIQHGLDLIGSRKGFGAIKLLGSQQGQDFQAYLPYPKRFYNDVSRSSAADAHQSYPEHWPISRLFAEAAARLESLWKTRAA